MRYHRAGQVFTLTRRIVWKVPEEKKINPRQIDEKAILEKVAALGAQGIYSSSSSKAMPVRKEDDIPLPEAGGISEEQEIGEYINSHLNDFSSPRT